MHAVTFLPARGLRAATAVAAAGLSAGLVAGPPAPEPMAWAWPLDGGPPVVVREFDPPELPWQPGHRGVDLLAGAGSTVRAAGAGVVTYAGPVAGIGVVTVTHGALRTTYQPVTASVVAGERVDTGTPIGTLSAAGSHCAPSACLHWGLLRGDVYLDPVALVLRTARPRLLPLGGSAISAVQPPGADAATAATAVATDTDTVRPTTSPATGPAGRHGVRAGRPNSEHATAGAVVRLAARGALAGAQG